VDESSLTAEILWLCYQLDMNIHPLETREELLVLIKTLVIKRERLRNVLKDNGVGKPISS
jgi:hypothetical protein